LKVPDDLSVIGFDNVPESALTHPPLTTVAQPIQTLGYEAVRMLITLIEQPDRRLAPPTQVALPTKLVVRSSTAPPRQDRS
jgi:LacI family transcriptional regulator